MSRFNLERLRLVVSDTAAALYTHTWRKGWALRASVPLAASFRFQPEALLASLPELFAGQDRHARLAIVLPDKAARFFKVVPPQNMAGFSELRAVAALRFETLFGLPAAEWRIEADWQGNQPFLACALPQSLIASLRQFAECQGLSLTRVQPAFIQRWNEVCPRLSGEASWFMSAADHRATAVAISRGVLTDVFQMELPSGWLQHPERLREPIEEALFRLQLNAPTRLYVAGEVEADWRTAVAGDIELVYCRDATCPERMAAAAVPLSSTAGVECGGER